MAGLEKAIVAKFCLDVVTIRWFPYCDAHQGIELKPKKVKRG